MNGNSTIRQRFQQASEPVEDIEEIEEIDTPDPEHYVAFGKAKGGRRGELGIKMHYDDGRTIEVMYYSYLMRVLSTSPDVLWLMYTDCVYTITGNNLTPLLSLVRDHKITFLQAFCPQKHPPLTADNDEMVITNIYTQNTDSWWKQFEARQAIREKEDA